MRMRWSRLTREPTFKKTGATRIPARVAGTVTQNDAADVQDMQTGDAEGVGASIAGEATEDNGNTEKVEDGFLIVEPAA